MRDFCRITGLRSWGCLLFLEFSKLAKCVGIQSAYEGIGREIIL